MSVAELNLGNPARPRRRRCDGEVTRLIDRIRELVADQPGLGGDSESERREINQREIARLQDRLAIAVRRELGRAAVGQSTIVLESDRATVVTTSHHPRS